MPVEVRLPQWGMGLQEGSVAHWLKKEGDYVNKEEPLVELDEAKVSDVLAAPESGYLLKIFIPEGQTVSVRTLLCLLGTQEELQSYTTDAKLTEELKEGANVKKNIQENPLAQQKSSQGEPQATPVARRLAKELGIDLSKVVGTGAGGRITDNDVLKYSETARQSNEVIPFTGHRADVAKHMLASLQGTAQLTLGTEVNVAKLVKLREKLRPQFDFTYTDLIIKAVALTLRQYQRINSWVDENGIHLQSQIDIGVAVALDEGLIVPVIRNADEKTLEEISKNSRSLADRARKGTLEPGEVTGSTFTVTNLGSYGIDFFTPVINLPEVAILGVGRIVEKPVKEQGNLDWQPFITLSLTFDHRAVDGAPAAEFLKAVGESLSEPGSLIN